MKVRFNGAMNKQDQVNQEAVQVIDSLGGPSNMAELLGGSDVITPQAISQWKKKGIPKGWRAFLRAKHAKAFAEQKA